MSVEKRKILSALTENFFRQINYLVIHLVKQLLSRNFLNICCSTNSFHIVPVFDEFDSVSSIVSSSIVWAEVVEADL